MSRWYGLFFSLTGSLTGRWAAGRRHVDPCYGLDFLHRADVHGGTRRSRALGNAVDMQGGPGVFKDDLYCPLFLPSGEYDYSCTPEETLAVAVSIPGCEVIIMKGLGHFPMGENPQESLKHLLPVLKKISG
jgi:pimeloyl-ACP methyl ester carboxylesterase